MAGVGDTVVLLMQSAQHTVISGPSHRNVVTMFYTTRVWTPDILLHLSLCSL